ncbi:hypothetical protein CNBN0300 [Cryptococcus deneoformans B-3501A]|uniref:hypothetical protein n=1 Tax=Cryptococcus deneoformans (strain B-3501A) TaxID=283643 RepID=UPI000043025D|nr:hypothetical protein CNBN0300 [Cryptococcus neoformans var. neoformans B-3501A]EAL17202.1 hypothetical protein CNBN0300 [Cryptococcus neoformans var. neoformans B-3501A]
MTFGQGNSEAGMSSYFFSKQHITPDAFKYDADKAKENVQQDVRRHDAFRQDTSSTASSLKPSGQQSLGDKVEQKIDQ